MSTVCKLFLLKISHCSNRHMVIHFTINVFTGNRWTVNHAKHKPCEHTVDVVPNEYILLSNSSQHVKMP